MKIQKVALVVIALCLLGLLASFIFNNNTKQVIYVETGVVINQYEGMKKARLQIEAKNNEIQAGVDSLISLFQKDLQDYEKTRKKLSSKERELKEELLRVRQQQLGAYQKAMDKKAQEEEQTLTQTQVNRINEFVKEYGKEKGYDFILGANGSGNIMYAKEGLNITLEVLEGLNRQYKEENGIN